MKRLVLAAILAAGILNATDFASMSTEDLVALKGTVSTEEQATFREEMQSRVSSMTTKEREALGITLGGNGVAKGTAARDGSEEGSKGAAAGGTGDGLGTGSASGSVGGHGNGAEGSVGGGNDASGSVGGNSDGVGGFGGGSGHGGGMGRR